jgi:NAD(P)-dependent dehydrogenase (short-subunit alcohol dehydrogenase family)
MFVKADVTDWTSIQGLFKAAVDAHGIVDFVFPNAGTSSSGFVGDLDRDRSIPPNVVPITVNLIGVVYTIQAALDVLRANPDPAKADASAHPHRKAWRGKIVVTASQSSLYPIPFTRRPFEN